MTVMFKPKDRAMTKGVWQTLNRLARINERFAAPYLDAAHMDMLIYGRGTVDYGAIQRDIDAWLAKPKHERGL